jgi:hypothetical protein
MIHCHHCNAVIATGHQRKHDGHFYHVNCVPTKPTATIGVENIQMASKNDEALKLGKFMIHKLNEMVKGNLDVVSADSPVTLFTRNPNDEIEAEIIHVFFVRKRATKEIRQFLNETMHRDHYELGDN